MASKTDIPAVNVPVMLTTERACVMAIGEGDVSMSTPLKWSRLIGFPNVRRAGRDGIDCEIVKLSCGRGLFARVTSSPTAAAGATFHLEAQCYVYRLLDAKSACERMVSALKAAAEELSINANQKSPA